MRYGMLAVFLFACYAAAGVGSLLTSPGLPWLATLNKPPFNPPNWVFGPVWTTLYTLMAISGWLVYDAPPSPQRAFVLGLFASQLCLNVLWSALFFYQRQPGLALLDIVFLLGLIWFYVVAAWTVQRTAALLFVPYGLWVAFATYLNAAFWRLN